MSHYFTTPEGPQRRHTAEMEIWGHELTMATARGTFSADGLDLGTQVLLRSATPDPGSRHVLDLGCGWGPIAVGLGLALPCARVDAVDTNELALELTRENAAAHGLGDRVRATTGDAVSVPADGYDEIWSNPPIRIGKPALHALLTTWLPRLSDTGRAHLVVGKHLGADSLQRWLNDQGFATSRIASAKGFRVFLTTKD